MSGMISAILAMIEQLLPAITSSSNATMIDSILNALSGMLPYIIADIENLYQPVKNVIDALSANPATNAQQLATLQQLDSQADTAFAAAAKDTDSGV